MKITAIAMSSLILLSFISYLSSYAEPVKGLLLVDVKSWVNERPTHQGLTLKIYNVTSDVPMDVVPSSNPYEISLPLGHRYKVEVYAGGMYADVGFVDLGKNQKLDLTIPIPGSVLFTATYSDGGLPLEGASVFLRSADGSYRYWTNSTTDQAGNTIRFWVQPTVLESEYYVAEVSLDEGLSYVYSPITVDPGLPQDIKIITPWPKVIDQLITVSVYDSEKKVSGLGKNLAVELYDRNGELVGTSKVNHKGDANFYNLKVGTYDFRAVSLDGNKTKEWGSTKVTLSGRTDPIQIFTKTYESNESYLVSNDSIEIPIANSTVAEPTTEIPSSPIPQWIRSVANWWSKGQISDAEFLKAIEYLVNNNVISIQHLQSG